MRARNSLAADRGLDHLLVLAEVQRSGRPQIADAERCQPSAPIQELGAPIVEMQEHVMLEILGPLERARTVTQQ